MTTRFWSRQLGCALSLAWCLGASILLAHAEEADNPWNEPRLGPAEARQNAPEINTWSEDPAIESEEGKFPPMDEDDALGIDPSTMYTPAPVIDTPATMSAPVEAAPATYPATPVVPTYPPAAAYGYTAPAQTYAPPYYSAYGPYGGYAPYGTYPPYGKAYRGYPGSRRGNWGRGFWPGDSWGGFPFGGSDWMPFSDSWFW